MFTHADRIRHRSGWESKNWTVVPSKPWPLCQWTVKPTVEVTKFQTEVTKWSEAQINWANWEMTCCYGTASSLHSVYPSTVHLILPQRLLCTCQRKTNKYGTNEWCWMMLLVYTGMLTCLEYFSTHLLNPYTRETWLSVSTSRQVSCVCIQKVQGKYYYCCSRHPLAHCPPSTCQSPRWRFSCAVRTNRQSTSQTLPSPVSCHLLKRHILQRHYSTKDKYDRRLQWTVSQEWKEERRKMRGHDSG